MASINISIKKGEKGLSSVLKKSQKEEKNEDSVSDMRQILTGQMISNASGFIRGHGTYQVEGNLIASVSGTVERVNRWISVRPFNHRYRGEVGDVVVGRITEVLQKSWKVDINSKEDAMLQLSAINLPGGVLRRRTTSDELQMRNFFVENDTISAEVQQIYSEGSLHLHTRSLKYGKLANGCLVTVPSSLIKNVKNHFVVFDFGIELILGKNGNIWVTDKIPEHSIQEETMQVEIREIPEQVREKMVIIRNSILVLAHHHIPISPDSISDTYFSVVENKIAPKEMFNEETSHFVTQRARLQ